MEFLGAVVWVQFFFCSMLLVWQSIFLKHMLLQMTHIYTFLLNLIPLTLWSAGSCQSDRGLHCRGPHLDDLSGTEFLIIGSLQQLSKATIELIVVGTISIIRPTECVRNLDAWFHNHTSVNTDVGKVCSEAFHGLYNIRHTTK